MKTICWKSSFPATQNVGNVGIFLYYLNSENMLDRRINHFNFNSKYHGKCKSTVILIKLFLSLSSSPVFEFRPPPKRHSAVAISIYIYSVYIYILFISKRVRGHYGELISVKIQ